MEKKLIRALAIVFALAFAGCGDDSNDAGTVTVTLSVVEFEPGMDDVPLEGAEVCVANSTNCVTSDADGVATLEVQANAEIVFEVTAEGYGATLTPLTTTDQDVPTLLSPLLSDSIVELLAGVLGTPYPFGDTGVIAISMVTELTTANNDGIAGVTLTPDREAISYYLDEDEIPRLDATATAEPSGAAGFIELEPGTLEVALGGTASNCVPAAAWPGADESSVRMPVRANFITQAIVICDPVSAP